MRTALAIAIENPHLAVTFLPLGLFGRDHQDGISREPARARMPEPGYRRACPGTARAQISELTDAHGDRAPLSCRSQPRPGAAHHRGQRHLFSGLDRQRHHRARHRAQPVQPWRHPCVGRGRAEGSRSRAAAAISPSCVRRSSRWSADNLSRVVYVTYGNPALAGPDTPCPGGRDGFDVHPAFARRRRAAAPGRGIRRSRKFLPGDQGARALRRRQGLP